jgi:hypothetical protein
VRPRHVTHQTDIASPLADDDHMSERGYAPILPNGGGLLSKRPYCASFPVYRCSITHSRSFRQCSLGDNHCIGSYERDVGLNGPAVLPRVATPAITTSDRAISNFRTIRCRSAWALPGRRAEILAQGRNSLSKIPRHLSIQTTNATVLRVINYTRRGSLIYRV